MFIQKYKWIIGLIIIILVAAVAAAVIIGSPEPLLDQQEDPTEPSAALELPESAYNIYCVLTEGAIRYGADGESYEIDTWSLDQNQAMTLTIDMSGIIPRDGRVYRVYVPKEGQNSAVFASPVVSGGMQACDFTRQPVAYRDDQWLYDGGMQKKVRVDEDSVVYYLQVIDGRLRRVDATSVTNLAQFNGTCSMDETHAHTNGCYLYNAYLKYSGGFLNPYVVEWAALSVDGSSIYNYIGTDEDSQYACLPGQDSTKADVVVTTTDPLVDGTIQVTDLNGQTFPCKISAEGLEPVGGRIYRIDEADDGSVIFSPPSSTGDGYDLINAPVVESDADSVIFLMGRKRYTVPRWSCASLPRSIWSPVRQKPYRSRLRMEPLPNTALRKPGGEPSPGNIRSSLPVTRPARS